MPISTYPNIQMSLDLVVAFAGYCTPPLTSCTTAQVACVTSLRHSSSGGGINSFLTGQLETGWYIYGIPFW
jgi:hypothetical protein